MTDLCVQNQRGNAKKLWVMQATTPDILKHAGNVIALGGQSKHNISNTAYETVQVQNGPSKRIETAHNYVVLYILRNV